MAALASCFDLSRQPGNLFTFLRQRAYSVDRGGTWGIPGGAIRAGESPELAARREAEEGLDHFHRFGSPASKFGNAAAVGNAMW